MSRPHPCRRLEIRHHHPSLVYHWEELVEESTCPLCKPYRDPDNPATTSAEDRKKHVLSVHWKNRLPFADGYLLPCQLACTKKSPHYHCPGCGQLVDSFEKIRRHVYSCANTIPPWVRRVEQDIVIQISQHGRSSEPLRDMKFVGLPGWQLETDVMADDEDVPVPCPYVIPGEDCDKEQARLMLVHQFAEEHHHLAAASQDFLDQHKAWISHNYHESHVHSLFDVTLCVCTKSCCVKLALYHCPLCPSDQRGMGWQAIHAHLSSVHWKGRLSHRGLQILVCHLSCLGERHPHHHCPECGLINCSTADLQYHLKDHIARRTFSNNVPICTVNGGSSNSATLNTSINYRKDHTDMTPNCGPKRQPSKVFASVGAVLMPELMTAIPGCQSSFLKNLESSTGVHARLSGSNRCLLRGDWQALNKAHQHLEEMLCKTKTQPTTQGGGDFVVPGKKYVMNLKLPSQHSGLPSETRQVFPSSSSSKEHTEKVPVQNRRSQRGQKQATEGACLRGSSHMNPSVSLCRWSKKQLLHSWRQLPPCNKQQKQVKSHVLVWEAARVSQSGQVCVDITSTMDVDAQPKNSVVDLDDGLFDDSDDDISMHLDTFLEGFDSIAPAEETQDGPQSPGNCQSELETSMTSTGVQCSPLLDRSGDLDSIARVKSLDVLSQPSTDSFESPTLQQPSSAPNNVTLDEKEAVVREPRRGEVNCPFCPQTFRSQSRWMLHLVRTLCGRKRLDKLPEHIASRLRETWDAVATAQCPLCNHKFTSLSLAQKHYMMRHCEKAKEKQQQWEQSKMTVDATTGRLRCSRCQSSFRTKTLAVKHYIAIHSEKTLSCTLCDRQFASRSILRRHVLVSHGDTVQCDFCGKQIKTYRVRAHKKRHIDKKDTLLAKPQPPVPKLICPMEGCGFKTLNSNLMARHSRTNHHLLHQAPDQSPAKVSPGKSVMNFQLSTKTQSDVDVQSMPRPAADISDEEPSPSGAELVRVSLDDNGDDDESQDMDYVTVFLEDETLTADLPGTVSLEDHTYFTLNNDTNSSSVMEPTVEAPLTAFQLEARRMAAIKAYRHCTGCRKTFSTSKYLWMHWLGGDCGNEDIDKLPALAVHHLRQVREVIKTRECPLCKKSFKKVNETRRHYMFRSCVEAARLEERWEQCHMTVDSTTGEIKCGQCTLTFTKKCLATQHYFRKHNGKPVSCSKCHRRYTSFSVLKRHIRRAPQGSPCSDATMVKLDVSPSWDPSDPQPGFACSVDGCTFRTSQQLLLTHHTEIEHSPDNQPPLFRAGLSDLIMGAVADQSVPGSALGSQDPPATSDSMQGNPALGLRGLSLGEVSEPLDDKDSLMAPTALSDGSQLTVGNIWFEVTNDSEVQELQLLSAEHANAPGIQFDPASLAQMTSADVPGGPASLDARPSEASGATSFQARCPVCRKGFHTQGGVWAHLCVRKCGRKYDRLPEHMTSKLKEARETVTGNECPLCHRVFYKRKDAVKHYLLRTCEETEKLRLRWEQCQMTVDETTGHIQCSKCPRTFQKKRLALNHFLRVHSEKTVPCSQCSRRFATETLLRRHMRLSHCGVTQCHICGKMIQSRCVAAHVQRHEDKDSPVQMDVKERKPPREFTCPIEGCGFKALGQPKMYRHTKIVHGPHDQICPVCNKTFAIGADLRKHINTCHNPSSKQVVSCPQCPKLMRPHSLQRHILIKHTSEGRPFVCTNCGHGFHSAFNLQRHQEATKRRGEDCSQLKVFKCGDCHAAYSCERTLARHGERVHGHPSRLLCVQCGERFSTRRLLQEHMDTHRSERYRCNICDLSFTSSNGLRKHHIRHEQRSLDNSCACGMQFPAYASLVVHHRSCPQAPRLLPKPKPKRVRSTKKISTKGQDSVLEVEQPAVSFTDDDLVFQVNEQLVAGNTLSGLDLLEVVNANITHEYQCGCCQLVFPTMEQINDHIIQYHADVTQLAAV